MKKQMNNYIDELASRWLKTHPNVTVDWKKKLSLWLKTELSKNPDILARYIGEQIDITILRDRLVNTCMNKARSKVEQTYAKTAVQKKGWLKNYRKTEEYKIALQQVLSEDKEYLLLTSDVFQQSRELIKVLEEEQRKKKEQLFIDVESAVNEYLIVRVQNESLEYIRSDEIKKNIEELALQEIVFQRMEKHLTTEKIKGMYGRISPTEQDIRYLLDTYVKCLINGRLTEFMNKYAYFHEFVYNRLKNQNKRLKMYASISSELEEQLKDELEREFHLDKMIKALIRERITEEYLLQCLSKNLHYMYVVEHVKRQIQYERYIKNGILDRIPERYEDLYPLARTMKRHFVLHIGPTNSGKTYDAMHAFRESKKGIYLGPLRLMAYEVYEESNRLNCPCHMHTGEEDIVVEGATHTACTIEMADYFEIYDVCVIDEAQMLEDESRGGAWTAAILGMRAHCIHVCAAESALDIVIRLIKLCNNTYEVVKHKRAVPLIEDKQSFHFPSSVRKNDALIVFSKKNVLYVAAELQKKSWNVSVIYGSLPYETRQEEVEKFRLGKTDIVVSTDAMGMGMNLPVERIVFLKTEKFDGKETRKLTEQEFKQIAGRAGRRGLYEIGYYTAEYDRAFVTKSIQEPCRMIQKVYLDFPDMLLAIDSNLSDILSQWLKIPADGLFYKQDIQVMIELARELEAYSEDKNLIYHFITIPFEEKNHALRYMWKKLFIMHNENMSPGILDFLDTERKFSLEQLDALELEYKKSDLLYNYLRKFDRNEEKEYVLRYKKLIAKQISSYLAKQTLPEKKCCVCGRTLAWNFPYRECDKCHYNS